MATSFERVDQLRRLLGMSQAQFTQRVERSRGSWNNWREAQKVDDAVLDLIADRWQLSLDSLKGREATTGVEPSPALRMAQDLVLLHVVQLGTVSGTPGERVLLCHRLLNGEIGGKAYFAPVLSEQAWAEWLHCTETDWLAITAKPDRISPQALSGAAFVLGWTSGERSWATWFETGRPAELEGAAEEIIKFMRDRYAHGGLDVIDLRRKLIGH